MQKAMGDRKFKTIACGKARLVSNSPCPLSFMTCCECHVVSDAQVTCLSKTQEKKSRLGKAAMEWLRTCFLQVLEEEHETEAQCHE